MKTLNEYLLSKGISIDELADKYREEILNKRLFPDSKAIEYIRKDFEELDNDGIKQLVEKVLEPIYKEDKFQYNYFLFTLAGKYCNYIDTCNNIIATSKREIEDGVDVEANKEIVQEQELEINDTYSLIELLNNIMNEYSEKKSFISIAFLNKYVHKRSGNLTHLLFPEGSKYENYYLVVPEELIESNEHYIHEEYISFSENKCWVVLPNSINITLRHIRFDDAIIISANELKEAMKL